MFPSILGHEGAGVVVETGPDVTSVKAGDHVIPLYTPECRQCEYCLSGKTNLYQAIRVTQGQGVMPDGTSRFSMGGEMLYHYMGTSTFANYTVLREIARANLGQGVIAGLAIAMIAIYSDRILQSWSCRMKDAASTGN